MDTLLTDERPIARKEYHCQASDWINDCGWADGDWTQEEAEDIEAARKDGWKIRKGERYVYQTGRHEGEMVTFRAKERLHEICLRHNLYET